MNDISLDELYFTYRKVKRELFNNKDTNCFYRIVEFEKHLVQNIENLHVILNEEDVIIINRIEVGKKYSVLKKIDLEEKQTKKCNLIELEVKTLSDYIDYSVNARPKIKNIEFRDFGDLTIEFQIIAGLWLNRVGYYFENKMSSDSYGNRLKEYTGLQNYTENHTYYKPYYNEYKKWQINLIDQITECNCSDEVLVITTDFQNFFPNVNLEKLKEIINTGFKHKITDFLFNLIEKFNTNFNCKGLPLNLICSSTLANIYLMDFDNMVQKDIKPLYYGRYVDDILLAIDSKTDFAQSILSKENNLIDDFCKKIELETSNLSLEFNIKKSKVFLINDSDKNKFKELKEHLNEVSSEWRLIPSTEKYNNSNTRSNSFFSDDFNTSHFVSLKDKQDEITRRNYFIKEIISFERSYFYLEVTVWKKRLNSLFEVVEDIIFDLKSFNVFVKYLPRIVGLLMQTSNVEMIDRFLHKLEKIFEYIDDDKNYINTKKEVESDEKYKSFIDHIKSKSLEFCIYFKPLYLEERGSLRSKRILEFFKGYGIAITNKDFFNCDMHFEPFNNTFYKYDEYQRYLIERDINNLPDSLKINDEIKLFISSNLSSNSCQRSDADTDEKATCVELYNSFGFYFFTRRISLLELSIAFKNKVIQENVCDNFKMLSKRYYSKFSKNINIGSKKIDGKEGIKQVIVKNYETPVKSKITVCNTHFYTKEDSYTNKLLGLPETDETRVDRLINLINNVIRCGENIDYLIFHEVSIPRNIYIILAKKLAYVNINLIAGLEYKIDEKNKTIDNQMVYVLSLNNEYSESICLYQSKKILAIHEEREIRERKGYRVKPEFKDKLVINHNEFFFSGLICNDLINIENRFPLRGEIDCLFVLAWNKDIGMYEHLVQTTSFDVHAYVLLCNNRSYGDSHIFVPYSKAYLRYLQRISGGKKDNFMVSDVDICELRKFQINEISPKEPFKPTPTGYDMSTDRKDSLKRLMKRN